MPSKIYSLFTKADGGDKPLYRTGDDQWVRMRMTLVTVGVVFVATSSDITPPGPNGVVLQTNVEKVFDLAPGTDFYVRSNSVNRIDVSQEPIPEVEYGKQIRDLLKQIVSNTAAVFNPLAGSMLAGALKGGK